MTTTADHEGHLTVEQLAGYLADTLDDKARAGVEAHLAVCPECSARADPAEPTTKLGLPSMPPAGGGARPAPRVMDAADRFERGSAIGRYLVLDILGTGGMGVVYSAFDPELDRRVAVKLLQARTTGSELGLTGGQAWLLREAQAMARLSHPNVLAVHDVGTLSGDRVFLAMELVEGKTLRAWLKEKARPHTETVPVLAQAGAGLAAAHAAGLVHRDFKPDNVLVGDDGRRVKVMDFGLARLAKDEVQDAAADDAAGAARSDADLVAALSPLTADLTQPGRLLGTPGYMAPELHQRAADAKSDQFAFGVTLYEAVYGNRRPFTREAMLTASAAKPLVPAEPPSDTQVPPYIKAVIWRAIAHKPEDRFPTMDVLLAALAHDPDAHKTTRSPAGAAAVVAGALVLVAAMFAFATSQRSHACTGAASALGAVWSPAKQEAVRAAFAKTGRPFAAEAGAGVVRAIDAYAVEWSKMSMEACEATRVRHEQSDAILSLRESCLADRLYEVDALVSLLTNADAALVEKSDRAVFALDPVRRCANVLALQAPGLPPSDAESQGKVEQVKKKLAAAKAALDAGHFDDAVAAAGDARALAEAVHYPAAEAQALLWRGMALNQSGKPADAVAALADAAFVAMKGKRDDVAAQAALVSAQNAGDALGKDGEARVWLGLAEAEAARVGVDKTLAVRLLEVKGVVAGARGDLRQAAELHEQALASAVDLLGADAPALWRNEQLLAASLAKAGDYAKALPHYERALALKERTGGGEHPDVALILTSLGACYDHVGAGDKAFASLSRALAIREKNFGKDSPKLVATLNNIADLLRQQGKVDEALAHAQRGYDIASEKPGPAHPLTHIVGTTLAEALASSGKTTEARALLDDLLAREEKASSPVLPTTLASRAWLAAQERSWSDADAFAARAVALFEKSGGLESSDLVRPLSTRAEAQLALGKRDLAKPLVERAIAIGTKAQLKDSELAAARAARARTVP